MSEYTMALDYSNELEYFCEWINFDTISGAIVIPIFIFSLIGNSLLICVLFIYEKMKNATNLFILNLACSDLVFTFTLPFWAVYYLHHWVFGDFLCKLVTAANFLGLYSSIILLTATTVDRFITVVLNTWPGSQLKRERCAIAACAAAWVISIGASVSDAVKVQVEIYWDNRSSCEAISDSSDVNLGYYLQVSLLFLLPFAIIVFCFSAILKTVLQASNRKRYRTIVVMFCIIVAFLVCWGPYNILLFIRAFYKPRGCYAEERMFIAHSIFRILAFSHCCMNPLLYMLSQKLRRHLLQLLRCQNAQKKSTDRRVGQNTSVIQNVAFIAQNSAVILELPSK